MDWIYQEVLTLQTLTELDGFMRQNHFFLFLSRARSISDLLFAWELSVH
jgi:hypothetical protein